MSFACHQAAHVLCTRVRTADRGPGRHRALESGRAESRATAAPRILERAGPHNNRLQLQLQQAPSLQLQLHSPQAHRSAGGHKGRKTPQPARAAEVTTTTAAPSGPVMGLRPPLLLPTLLTQLQMLGACCIYISTTSNTANTKKNTAVGVGEGPDFGSDCCEKHFSAQRSWKHRCVDPKLNGAHPRSLADGRVRGR